ncbi:hypothetical protein JXA88_03885 [Candidatus Fermentibacteria bacterium]|nr:hypothetical protein [Candidatus Fermentibacteria bacterium]
MLRGFVSLLLVGTTLSGCVSVPRSRTFAIMADSEVELARLARKVRGRDVWIRTATGELAEGRQLTMRPDTSTFLACEPWVPGPSLVSKTTRRSVPTESIQVVGASRSNEGFLRGMAKGAVIGAICSSLVVYGICSMVSQAVDSGDRPKLTLSVTAGGLCIAGVVGGVIGSNRAGTDISQLIRGGIHTPATSAPD